MIEAHPLYWPEGRTRTPKHKRQLSRFKTGFAIAVRQTNEELRRLGAKNVIISTDVPLRRDGLPLASAKTPEDTGAAIYFEYSGKQMCFACDRWNKVGDNIYAVAKTIEAMRGIERWGTGDMVKAAFTGFLALPPASDWRNILGNPSTLSEAESAYKALVRENHPDTGGSNELMAELNRAREMARIEFMEVRE